MDIMLVFLVCLLFNDSQWFHAVGIPSSTWQCRKPSWSLQFDDSSSSNVNLCIEHCAIVNTGNDASRYRIPYLPDLFFCSH